MEFKDFVSFVLDVFFIVLPFYLTGGKITSVALFSSGVAMFKLLRDLLTPSKVKDLETKVEDLISKVEGLEAKLDKILEDKNGQ